MGKGGTGLTRPLAVIGQLVLCAFFVSVYLRDQDHLALSSPPSKKTQSRRRRQGYQLPLELEHIT